MPMFIHLRRACCALFLILATEAATASQPKALPLMLDSAPYRAEIAQRPEELSRGYMARLYIARHGAMLFVLNGGQANFWMKNTITSLHILYLDACARVVEAYLHVPSCTHSPCPTYPSKQPDVFYALELRADFRPSFAAAPFKRHQDYRDPARATAPALKLFPNAAHRPILQRTAANCSIR